MKTILMGFMVFILTACAGGETRSKLPYGTWQIGLIAPRFMEVWIEGVDVIDKRGLAFERVHGGIPSYSRTVGWNGGRGGGATKPISNVDLPEIIFVRWQSLVEPQTYYARIDIPQWVRDEMVKPHRAFCNWDGKYVDNLYRETISIGMAPGGIAKAWVGGPCLEPIEIERVEAKIEKRGPSLGQTGGRYAWPDLEPESKTYIEKHGIPYGSW
ncbi:DUF2931 family protein [Pseudomonas matsuisoli]|uniref:DUF2931 family protein n=1 Tax=Pseudomonas matsuisoli TaxID=1515666 RepID=A0A917PYG0_9PSED|nr:DUF2931 family protein [Pseudomonas matsuisoli]GGJ99615.1 hypothetical protein GCM10009304_26790 [Pseudomonas matsuisoli]